MTLISKIVERIAEGIAREPELVAAALSEGLREEPENVECSVDEIRHVIARHSREGAVDLRIGDRTLLFTYCRSVSKGITHIVGRSELGNSWILQHASDLDEWQLAFA